MKTLRKKLSSLFFILLFGTFTLATTANAQPSIPRKTKTTKTYNSSSNTVWGTQYDWLSTRYVTHNDIAYMDGGQIRVLKNSIYARHGYIFQDSRLRNYFRSQSWYNGWRKSVPNKEFNKYEQYNIQFLKKYER